MRLALIAVAALTLLAAAGAALSTSSGVAHNAAQAAAAPQSPPGRVPVTAAQVREARAAGLLDRPIKSLLDVPERMQFGDFRWDDRGIPPGPTWVRVDLTSQLLSVFRSGHEIGTAVILYGTDGLPTPTGKFPILAKYKDHRSITYDNAPMPYTLRLTADGVSIHGSNVRWGYATHGCIGVPVPFAAKLFVAVHKGDEVLIVRGNRRAVS
jgi:hypothetical protein